MPFEMVVGLTVSDDALYAKYREGMTPILAGYGGGFRYDFVVSKVLASESPHAINRVFAISFPDRAARDAFYADPAYKAIRARFFDASVTGRTIIAEYTR